MHTSTISNAALIPPNNHTALTSALEDQQQRCLGQDAPTCCSAQISQLRESHASLLTQFNKLEKDVRSTRKIALETEAIVRGPSSFVERTIRRSILFANMTAQKALTSTHPEISRSYNILCPANSVRQIYLHSKPSDCTLSEFRIMASHFLNQEDIKCRIFPSAYSALFSSSSQDSCFQIVFESFCDLCQALQLSSNIRSAGVYKERKSTARDFRCVQIFGVDLVSPDREIPLSSSTEEVRRGPERKILLARSMPPPGTLDLTHVHVLHQPCTTWMDNSWEEGFRHVQEELLDLSAFKSRSSFTKSFRIQWERSRDSPFPTDSSAELIPGSLKSYFPAVVLRTRLLTRSVQNIFRTPGNGNSLRHNLCTPGTDEEH